MHHVVACHQRYIVMILRKANVLCPRYGHKLEHPIITVAIHVETHVRLEISCRVEVEFGAP